MNLLARNRFGAAIVAASLFSPLAFANHVNLGAYTIPASACQPANAVEDEKVKLVLGSYVFRANETGTVSLLCALPLSGWKAGVELFNQDWDDPTMNMTSYRVYYKDPNTCSSSVGVQVRLRYRNESNLISLNPYWTSWSNSSSPSICTPGIATHTTKEVKSVHQLREGRLYHFLVKIKRSATSQNPAFSGIDFPVNVQTPG